MEMEIDRHLANSLPGFESCISLPSTSDLEFLSTLAHDIQARIRGSWHQRDLVLFATIVRHHNPAGLRV